MASVEQFAEALVQLGYENFYDLKAVLNKGDRRSPKSVWGRLSLNIFGKNKDVKRNSGKKVTKSIRPKSNSPKPINFSDIPRLAIEHISTRLELDSFYQNSLEFSRISFSEVDVSVYSLERELMDDKLLGLWSSGCEDPELRCSDIRLSASPPHAEGTDDQFWLHVDCDNLIWQDAVHFFGLECPSSIGEFISVKYQLSDAKN